MYRSSGSCHSAEEVTFISTYGLTGVSVLSNETFFREVFSSFWTIGAPLQQRASCSTQLTAASSNFLKAEAK